MNNFENVKALIDKEIWVLKNNIRTNNLTVDEEISALNLIKELQLAILTLDSSIGLLKLGSIDAIKNLDK